MLFVTRQDEPAFSTAPVPLCWRPLLVMLFRPPFALPWDDLDSQSCGEAGTTPDWNTLVVVGPMKRRDDQGHTQLEWTVTVQCRPRPQWADDQPGAEAADK